MTSTQDSVAGGSILSRNFGLALVERSEKEKGGRKIYFNPYDFLISPVLLTAKSTLQNQWDISEEELEDLEQAVNKKEGSKNLIRTPHYEAILGSVEDKTSLPTANNEYLEGSVKSKSRGWHETTVERPYILRDREGELYLLLNDVRCQCQSSLHEAKRGGGWSTITACPHSSALWSDFYDYLSRSGPQAQRKKGWKLDEALEYDLFLPFSFIEDRDPDRELEVMEDRYLEGKNLYEINRELLQDEDVLSQDLKQLVKQGDVRFELLQQKRKKENISPEEKKAKAQAAAKIHQALNDHGLEMTGKYLEEGLPADRFEDREGNIAAGVIYAERNQLDSEPEEEEGALPILVATKMLGDEVDLAGNEERINPYSYVGSTWTRVDDRTRRKARVHYSTPNKIKWPPDVDQEEVELELKPSVIRKSKKGIEDYAKSVSYSLRQAFGLR